MNERFAGLRRQMKRLRVPYKVSFIVLGIASTAWFLIRVIPKPSRATYPCMRAAAPFMSSFVIYLLSLTGTALLFKKSGQFLKKARYILAAAAFVGALVLFAFSSNILPERILAGVRGTTDFARPSDFPANRPMGEGLGIFPGRVVWEWDPDATNEDCTNDFNDGVDPDGYYMAKNNNQAVINRMFADVVQKLSGTYSVSVAWDSLFTDFNRRKGRGAVSYQPGQKIFIKINQGGAGWLTRDSDLSYESWAGSYYPNAETSGPMAVSLLDQLINHAGVAQEDIYIGDPSAHILKDIYEQMHSLFPNVKYIDKDGRADLGRTGINKTDEPEIIWSDKRSVMNHNDIVNTEYLWKEMANAEYLINLATLKAHARAGVTLTAKNHFGSHGNGGGAWPLHDGLVCYVDNDVLDPIRNDYGMYRVLTDLMGHEKVGGNTVLFIIEGLWGGPEAVSVPVKWQMAPFNNDWPSSILASQDAVALESVCFDLLKTEFNDPSGPGKNRPWYGGVDDHLHQAADSENWPDGFTYDPEGDGTPMGSMGIHEHWNNEVDKQYSRNLGYDFGIELIAPKSLVSNAVTALETDTPPVIDGDMSDACWAEAQWYYIDQTWINWGEEIDSSDFFGRFKMSWSEAENLMYCLVEVTDDAFIDGYVFTESGYWNFDVVELFIDEDASGGIHQNDENAFAYHITMNAPADGAVENEFYACDLAAGGQRIDYADHLPELALKKMGNKYIYEFSMASYSDAYNHSNPEASRVTLAGGKEMGLSMAYCDNDTDDGQRDNFFGSEWVPEANFNDHWKNADFFGSILLVDDGTVMNQSVEVVGSISDYEIYELNTSLTAHDDLRTVFSDPDGDELSYIVVCGQEALSFVVEEHALKVTASALFTGDANVSVHASDGEYQVATNFYVSTPGVGISENGVQEALRCYPNPVSDLLYLEMHLGAENDGSLRAELYSLSGVRVMSLPVPAGAETMTLDMSELAPGQFILKVKAGDTLHSLMVNKR